MNREWNSITKPSDSRLSSDTILVWILEAGLRIFLVPYTYNFTIAEEN